MAPTPESWFQRAERALTGLLYHLSALFVIAITGVVFLVVIMRYVFNATPGWSEEVPRLLFLWLIYIAIGVAIRRGQNLRLTIIIDRFRPAPRLVLELFMHSAVYAMLGVLFWSNLRVVQITMQTTMLGTKWPDAVLYLALSVGVVLMALYQATAVARSIEDWRRARTGER